ncbi:MAG TPA: hypothetical protein VHC21_01200 [Candidatus Saccharimonadales bacterium]|nr:hypothetical protein [Candidatus Saccharimonadales bacterium]
MSKKSFREVRSLRNNPELADGIVKALGGEPDEFVESSFGAVRSGPLPDPEVTAREEKQITDSLDHGLMENRNGDVVRDGELRWG